MRVGHGNGRGVGLREQQLADRAAPLCRKAATHVVLGCGGHAQGALGGLRAAVVGGKQAGACHGNDGCHTHAGDYRSHQIAVYQAIRQHHQQQKRDHTQRGMKEPLGVVNRASASTQHYASPPAWGSRSSRLPMAGLAALRWFCLGEPSTLSARARALSSHSDAMMRGQ